MKSNKLKALFPLGVVSIVETCIVSAMAVAGLATPALASTSTEQQPGVRTAAAVAHLQATQEQTEGAIILRMVHTDMATGQQVAEHYSHSSHASHHSHYSSR
jgi:hypothetical protein